MKPKDNRLVRVNFRPPGVNEDFKTIRVTKQDDDITTVRVLVTTHGSPQVKDLHGTFFSPETYFGDDLIQVKFAVYEHFHNAWSNPYMPDPKMQLLGVAKFAEKDEWGRWFDFELQRSAEYHDYVTELIKLGVMGASTQTYQGEGAFEYDSKTGFISRWLENEVSLTPTPADPKTIDAVALLAKNFKLPDNPEIWKYRPTVINVKNEEPAADFEQEVLDALTNGTAENQPVAELVISDDFAKTLEEIVRKASVGVMVDFWGSMEEAPQIFEMLGRIGAAADKAAEDAAKAYETALAGLTAANELKKAMTGMAGHIGDQLKLKVQQAADEQAKLSEAEKRAKAIAEAEALRKRSPSGLSATYIPANAPGG